MYKDLQRLIKNSSIASALLMKIKLHRDEPLKLCLLQAFEGIIWMDTAFMFLRWCTVNLHVFR